MSNKNDLFEEINQLDDEDIKRDNSSPMNKKGRKVELSTLHFDVDMNEDNDLAVFIKNLINEHNITNQDVYDMFSRGEGWNMIYGLKKGSISWDRVKKWCQLMGYSVEITLVKIDKNKK